MEAHQRKFGRKLTDRVRSKGFWKDAYRWDRAAGSTARAWETMKQTYGLQDWQLVERGFLKPERPRVFPSLCDPWDDEVPLAWFGDLMLVVHETSCLNWLLLTKRPENFWPRLEALCRLWACDGSYRETREARAYHDMLCRWRAGTPPDNVWLGSTAEDQACADKRIPVMQSIPAKVRWLSCEPLLEKIDLTPEHDIGCGLGVGHANHLCGVSWVVVGGESGKDRREAKGGTVEAVASVAEQCRAARVPVWVKQDCAHAPSQQGRIPDDLWALKQLPGGAL